MRSLLGRALAVLLLITGGALYTATSAQAGTCPDNVFKVCGKTTHDYAEIGWTRQQVLGLPKFKGDKGGAVVASDKKRPVYEYRTLANCYQARPGTPTEGVTCMAALRTCPEDTV
ncbi:MAG: hypothetical protein L0H79_19020, partial [Intrasporangium sp.]|uniref:hypothetical protein n=1 Tax=Intrasporangium sp. TaxID=1925024 RepID=UPI00264870BF